MTQAPQYPVVISFDATLLRRALAVAKLRYNKQSLFPALRYARLHIEAGVATISCTNLECWVDVSFAIAADALHEVALLDLAALEKRLPTRGPVSLSCTSASEDWWISTGNKRLRVGAADVADWPTNTLDDGAGYTSVFYEGDALCDALRHARRAMSTDSQNPNLCFAYLDNQGCVAGLDRHRVHWTEGLPPVPGPGWLLPSAAVDAILGGYKQLAPTKTMLERTGAHGLVWRARAHSQDLTVSITFKQGELAMYDWRRAIAMHQGSETRSARVVGPDLRKELVQLKRVGLGDHAVMRVMDDTVSVVLLDEDDRVDGRVEMSTYPNANEIDDFDLEARYLREALESATAMVEISRGVEANSMLMLDLGGGQKAGIMVHRNGK